MTLFFKKSAPIDAPIFHALAIREQLNKTRTSKLKDAVAVVCRSRSTAVAAVLTDSDSVVTAAAELCDLVCRRHGLRRREL